MFRPLSETEKIDALRAAATETLKEMKRREPELAQLRATAQAVFQALVDAPTLRIEQAPMPSGMTEPPMQELWSVKPKVTFNE